MDRSTRTAAVLATAVAVPVVLVAAFLIEGGNGGASPTAGPTPASSGPPSPLTTTVPAPAADVLAACEPVVAAMPVSLDSGAGAALRPVTVTPGGPTFLAWGEPLVTLQCGVSRPAALTSSSGYVPYAVSPPDSPGATWLVEPHGDRDTWTVIDRAVYIAVTVPHAETGYLTDISGVIGSLLPAVCQGPVDPNDAPDTQYCGSRP